MNRILKSDLQEFFELNNVISIEEADFNQLLNSKSTKYTVPIIDYILSTMIKVKSYKLSEILLSPDQNLTTLANQLKLPNVDKDRIIRILKYANKLQSDLEIFDLLPKENILEIVKYLSCEDLLRLCRISNKMNFLCGEDILRSRINVNYDISDYDKYELINTCLVQKQINNIAAGDKHVLILRPDGKVFGYGSNKGYLPKAKYLGIEGIQVACGKHHSLVLTKDHKVVAIDFGKSRRTFEVPKIIQIAAGSMFSLFLDQEGTVYQKYNLLDSIDKYEGLDIIAISAGKTHSLMLSKSGQLYSMGFSNFGQLGTGDSNDYKTPQLIMNNVIYISAGDKSSVVIDDEGTKVFGAMFGNYYESPILVNIKGSNFIAGTNCVYTIDFNGQVKRYDAETEFVTVFEEGVTELAISDQLDYIAVIRNREVYGDGLTLLEF